MIEDWKKHAEGRATVGFFHRQAGAGGSRAVPAGRRPSCLRGRRNEGRGTNSDLPRFERGPSGLRGKRRGNRTRHGHSSNRLRPNVYVRREHCSLAPDDRARIRIHPEVPDCIVLDHGDGIQKGWFFEDEVHWTLEWGDRPAKSTRAVQRSNARNADCRTVAANANADMSQRRKRERPRGSISSAASLWKSLARSERKRPRRQTSS